MVQGTDSHKILSPRVILSMKKTMAAKVINAVKSVSGLKIFQETGHRAQYLNEDKGIKRTNGVSSTTFYVVKCSHFQIRRVQL